MTETFNVVVLVGSLRAASITRKLAHALIDVAPKRLDCRIEEIGDLALYNEDLEQSVPVPWTRFREAIRGADGVLFVTPEYNRSMPGALKNALDVGSRPQGKSVWTGKAAAVASVTPYKLGAFGANHAVRQTFVFLDMPAMQQPELYLGNANEVLADDGTVRDKDVAALLQRFMTSFDAWIARIRSDRPAHASKSS